MFYGTWTATRIDDLKSQDILILFKLTSLYAHEENLFGSMSLEPISALVKSTLQPAISILTPADNSWGHAAAGDQNTPEEALFRLENLGSPTEIFECWEGWTEAVPSTPVTSWRDSYSLRALSASLGLSKSEVSNALVRCRNAGMLTNDYDTSLPRVNRRALLLIAEHAVRYFFPVTPGGIVRGIPTGFAAPALSKRLKSAGGMIPVWPDPVGNERGQAIKPLYESVPEAVKNDRNLYHYLALIDAIRLGGPREREVAVSLLKSGMGLENMISNSTAYQDTKR